MADDSGISIDGPDTLRGALLLLVLGLGVTGYGAYDYVQQSDAIRSAVEVDATITDVGVETTSAPAGNAQVKYEPRVEFTYEYQGESYTGTNVFPATIAPEYEQRSNAESVIDEYEDGMTVTAYVDPADPNDAFLQNKTSNTPLLAAGIGAVISLLGAVSALEKYRNK
ncbi:DUF3592 domain-containing protein [Halobellus marinus]|uniref:DUF3592 domain-containing protein n=1 Tax=Halobellus TaxID=1073986 RepID=UPI0028A66741|nr:DUF3592 domain-containing protein [Halobellus sp. DFY28]